ncbi:hypothetical protein DFJ73DRAFT_758701 [Zopfochytrium polystomum]|nr:hypothetical protein DFJ73DRAFT_758701 [Zopfochytrium polystomum]
MEQLDETTGKGLQKLEKWVQGKLKKWKDETGIKNKQAETKRGKKKKKKKDGNDDKVKKSFGERPKKATHPLNKRRRKENTRAPPQRNRQSESLSATTVRARPPPSPLRVLERAAGGSRRYAAVQRLRELGGGAQERVTAVERHKRGGWRRVRVLLLRRVRGRGGGGVDHGRMREPDGVKGRRKIFGQYGKQLWSRSSLK